MSTDSVKFALSEADIPTHWVTLLPLERLPDAPAIA